MSLINQMLRDLEQRRTAEAGSSPLGGLSASGQVAQAVNFSINYTTLSVIVGVVFILGLVIAFFLGSQQQTAATENIPLAASMNEIPAISSVMDNKPTASNVKEAPPATAVSQPVVDTKVEAQPVKEVAADSTPVVEKSEIDEGRATTSNKKSDEAEIISIEVAQTAKPESSAALAEVEEEVNKSVRPLTDEQQSLLAFQSAVKLLGRGDESGAKQALDSSLNFSPTNIRARETLAALLLNAGRISEAASSLSDGLKIMPGATPLAKLYARILVDQGDAVTAINVLERARPAVSADPDYHALLAALYRQEEKHAQAARTYQQILMQRPGVASWWMGLALSQDAMGEKSQALDAFRRAQRAGGLNGGVLRYVQDRIVALTPVVPEMVNTDNDSDEFGE